MPVAMTDFVPAEFDATDWSAIEPLLADLQARPVQTPEDLQRWLADRSELEAACSEARANLYITMTCHTDDDKAMAAYSGYMERIPPRLKPELFRLDQRLVELFDRIPMDPARYEVLERDTRAEVELFRAENVQIETELSKLSQEFGRISGAQTVRFDGAEKTMPEMAVYLESTDRDERQRAWEAIAARRLQDADALEDLFDQMIAKRDAVARNADLPSYVEYAFKSKLRFDYTPADCETFQEAVEAVVVPFNERLAESRRKQMGLETLRPWDLGVDPQGRPALKPFAGGRELYDKTQAAFNELDPRLAELFAQMGEGLGDAATIQTRGLDLDTRKGKAPGGYQYMRDRAREPFIFMNAAGLHRDVETMVHEAGHAFHSMVCVDEPLLHYRHAPMEFCEVASMAMEKLTMPTWGGPDGFYPDEADLARAQRHQLEKAVSLLAWIATIDAFQHWLYRNPQHTRAERTAQWLALDARFGSMATSRSIDWSGLNPRYRETVWHKQGHLFSVPFYYIEYGIAQIGALGVWVNALEQGTPAAVDAYLEALRLGGTRPLPELFEACGLTFDFSAGTIARLVDRVEAELAKLPD